jgi:hypothetical protein
MERRSEDLGWPPRFNDLSTVQDHDPVSDLADDRQIVGYQKQRQIAVLASSLQEVNNAGLQGGIDRRQGFVSYQQVRTTCQGSGNCYSLLLTT